MSVTVKISDESNAYLELLVGLRRMRAVNGDRVNKEDVASEAIKAFVIQEVPPALLKAIKVPDKVA